MENTFSEPQKNICYGALGLNVVLYYSGTNFFLPTLPDVAQTMHVSTHVVRLSVTFVLFGLALAQIFSGYLSDLYGKSKMILFFPPIFCFGSLNCALTHHISLFLFGMLCIGIGLGGIAVNSQALCHHLFGHRYVKVMSIFSLFANLTTFALLILSGFFAYHNHWQYIFFLMAIISCIIFMLCLQLPKDETLDNCHLSLKTMLERYKQLLTNRLFFRFAIPYSLCIAGMHVFASTSPFLFINDLHLTEKTYGFLMNFTFVGLIIGQYLAATLSDYFSKDTLVKFGGLFPCMGALLMLIFTHLNRFNAVEIIFAMAVYNIGTGLISNTLKSGSMAAFAMIPATTVALISFLANLVSGTGSYITSHFLTHSLAGALIVLSLLSASSYRLLAKR